MMIVMVLVMMMNVQLRDPVFEVEIWPRKRRTPRENVRSRFFLAVRVFPSRNPAPKQGQFPYTIFRFVFNAV